MKFAWKTTSYCVICAAQVTYYTRALGMDGECPYCRSSMGEVKNEPGTIFVEQISPWWKFWDRRYTV